MAKGKGDPVETAADLNSGAIHLLRAFRALDRQSGLTPARLSALSVLVFAGACTLGRLAATEGVAGPTMSRIVDGLVNLGLAAREPHPDSARLVRVAATGEGRRLMESARGRRIDTLVAAMRVLSVEEQHLLSSAAPLLDRLAALIRADLATGG